MTVLRCAVRLPVRRCLLPGTPGYLPCRGGFGLGPLSPSCFASVCLPSKHPHCLPLTPPTDNYCFYVENYDSLDAAYDWARDTLAAHAGDKREFLYTRAQLERGATHDKLWNAAQLEMVHAGKMHGFMRMYWAKKILEVCAARAPPCLSVYVYVSVCPVSGMLLCGWRTASGRTACEAENRRGVGQPMCCCRHHRPPSPTVDRVPRRGPGDLHLPERPVLAGRPRPQRLRRLHVVHRGHTRPGGWLGGGGMLKSP